ncbi:GDYXXLXY domain-containing protein [Termitidicoccus mucosus]|uniref:GDYXXLXY protein n=1 Tax=Termitidicoccus mucosus TaxID=1184151 RepID=A0A178INP3_9BACT|nr:hypothetical protein AW736_02865 [Opitutaceae bacterium TSB47]
MKNARLILFAIFAALTLAAPLSMIWKYENTLRRGTLHKFRTQPVDPYDAFRGRYVTLSYQNDFVMLNEQQQKNDFPYGVKGILYVRLKTDDEGFAVPVEASWTTLTGNDVVIVELSRYRGDDRGGRMNFNYPFNRYYLPEDVAPMAEKLYNDANRRGWGGVERGKSDTYVAVRVRNGAGVIEELYIDGRPVREAVRAELEKE